MPRFYKTGLDEHALTERAFQTKTSSRKYAWGGGMEDKQLDVLAVYWHKDEGEQCVGRDRSTERKEQRGRQFVEGIS